MAITPFTLKTAINSPEKSRTKAIVGDVSIPDLHPLKTLRRYTINLDKAPPDDTLFSGLTAKILLQADAIPWRKFGGRVIYAATDPAAFTPPENLPLNTETTSVALASRESIRRAINTQFADTLMQDAHAFCPAEYSCRDFNINTGSMLFYLGAVAILVAIIQFPMAFLSAAMIWVMIASLATTTLRISAVLAWRKDKYLPPSLPENYISIAQHRGRPKVTILVPLFHEGAILPHLIKTLSNLDYPRESFEVKFLLEAVDEITAAAIAKITLPEFIECLTVPEDWLQTKPKAMNYALPFCDGEIIGVYDAEDRPESDQILKIVDHFMAAPADVACLQGYLDFYNSRHNWLARCFTMEYATWFRVILKGIQRLRIPIPLGGTTVFFRRDILEEIGGWDAHNVTEDADLGMRLARFGYRCEMVNTTTWEEATARPLPWIRQRSRWLKGYAITWATHMRNPLKLWNDLGVVSFMGFQTIFLGGLSAFLAGPMFWALWLSYFGLPVIPIDTLPFGLWWLFAGTLIVGQVTMFSVMFLAIWNRERKHLTPYFLALPFYWPLGTFAAYKAIAELFYAPFYWDKTAHGIATEDHSPSASSRKRVS